MRISRRRAPAWVAGAALLAVGVTLAARAPAQTTANPPPAITDANLAELMTYVQPKPEEIAYLEVPWRPTLWEAIVEANRVDKPVLLWAMNGHPLGCT